MKLNGTKVKDTNHFFHLLRFAPPVARITLIRDEEKAAEIEAKVHIPPERMKFVQRRDGFEYLMAKLEWKPGGPKLGLGIRHYQNRVLVSRCDPNSLAAVQLKVGDHIVDIGNFRFFRSSRATLFSFQIASRSPTKTSLVRSW